VAGRSHGGWPRHARARLGGVALGAALALAATPAAALATAQAETTLEVSFEPGAGMRLESGRSFGGGTAAAELNAMLARHPGARVERVFDAPATSFDAARERLLARGRRTVPDLNRHFRIAVANPAERDALLAGLDRLPQVDAAMPVPAPPPLPATATPSFALEQGYSAGGSAGIDTGAFAALPGGRGEQAKIVDVEYAWNRAHEDLAKAAAPGALIVNGAPADPFPEEEAIHGTAVLGELIGTDNGFGITGLAPESAIGMVNSATAPAGRACDPACWDLPDAIDLARRQMAPGDVMLIEQQFPGRGAAGDHVPVELWPAAYDAIRLATQQGIIVVEAAGNGNVTGGVDLDAPEYGSTFPDGRPDSGAIVAGAGSGDCSAPANARLSFSSYGSRVDLQGWGQCVATSVTTGRYGLLFDGGTTESRYTGSFNGTSSAAPMVAAAAALYSSVYQATNGSAPTPALVRSRLVATGTPQPANSPGHIGPLPNLRAAAADFAQRSAAQASGNLVANPSFESGTEGWGSVGGTLSRVAVTGAPDGGWVARARRATGSSYSVSDNAGTTPTVGAATAGETYVAGCSVRAGTAQSAGRPVRIVLRERVGATGAVVKETVATSTLGTTFKRLTVSAVAVAAGNTMGVRCEQTAAVAGDAFDADQMTLAPASGAGGDTTPGTVWTPASVGSKRVSPLALAAPRDLVSLQAYVDGKGAATGSQPVTGVLYAGTASGPTTRVQATSAVTIAAGRAAGWVKLAFPTPVRVAAGTYWIGLHTGGTAPVLRFASRPVAGALRYNADAYADGAAATFGAASSDGKSLSLYAVGAWTP
jgi:serine protease